MSPWLFADFLNSRWATAPPGALKNQHEPSVVGDPGCSKELQGSTDLLSSVYVPRYFGGVWRRDSQRSRTSRLGSEGTLKLAGNKTRPCHETPDCRAYGC